MLDYTDNVRRAAETYLADRYVETPMESTPDLVVRGYTAEAIEEMQLPAADPEPACKPSMVYPAAA